MLSKQPNFIVLVALHKRYFSLCVSLSGFVCICSVKWPQLIDTSFHVGHFIVSTVKHTAQPIAVMNDNIMRSFIYKYILFIRLIKCVKGPQSMHFHNIFFCFSGLKQQLDFFSCFDFAPIENNLRGFIRKSRFSSETPTTSSLVNDVWPIEEAKSDIDRFRYKC